MTAAGKKTKQILGLPADLAPITLDERIDSATQIAAHLKQQLHTQGIGKPQTLILPCALALAAFYERGVLDVLDALFELKKQGCQYRIYGLDGEIQLWATQRPMAQQPVPTRQSRWQEWLKPVDTLTHRAQQSLHRFLILEG